MSNNVHEYLTEQISLPSKGLIYPKESPLSSGKIEIKYPTAKEEDILTNSGYIKNGTVFDKLLKSVIVTPGVNLDDLLMCDKNALLIAVRILMYGENFKFTYKFSEDEKSEITLNLQTIKEKEFDSSLFKESLNEFEYTLPKSKSLVKFKLLNQSDVKKINEELEGLKKESTENKKSITTKLKHQIISINGNSDPSTIRKSVDSMLSFDSKSLRDYIDKIEPDLDLSYSINTQNGLAEGTIPVTSVDFFWPDSIL